MDADLPGSGWLAVDDRSLGAGPDGGVAEWFDCVGPEFPSGDEIVGTASSPAYIQPPGRLVNGVGIEVADDGVADRAEEILRSRDFASCQARAISLDLLAGTDAELVDVSTVETADGYRTTFTGADDRGLRAVHLDVVVLRVADRLGVLWFGDTPSPFPEDGLRHVVTSIRTRNTPG